MLGILEPQGCIFRAVGIKLSNMATDRTFNYF